MPPLQTDTHDTAWKRFLHRRGLTKGDLVITAGGLGLAFACAAFPWYVFMNQDQFGPREMRFSGNMTPGSLAPSTAQPPLVMSPMTPDEFPMMELDLFATGTTGADEPRKAAASPQPFPGELPAYRLVHVANGRAMIEDDGGIFVVQPGSTLPDGTSVSNIEQREGKWVLVNSNGSVLTVE
ncbi:MAG: hypothetical protein ACK4R3_08200 [Aliihoeflea sp.]